MRGLASEMMLVDSVRGEDSTGLFTVDSSKNVNVWKKALHAHDFLQIRQTKAIMATLHDQQVLIGHNRAATKGEVTDDMAHPFTYGDITLVHNGTLRNHRTLCKDIPPFASDSEALCFAMSKIGPRAALEAANGAFSVIWYDRSNDTINLCRNDERPMSFALVEGGKRLVLASEAKMLRWMLDRANLEIEGNIMLPNKGNILTFKLNEDSDYTCEEIDLYKPTAHTNYGYSHTYGHNSQRNNTGRIQQPSTPVNLGSARIDRMNKLLDPIGRKLYDKIIFWGGDFEPYSASCDTGKMKGYDEYAVKDVLVMAHNINKSAVVDENEEFNSHLYEATIKAATYELNTGEVIINVDNVRAIDVDSYYSEESTIEYINSDKGDTTKNKEHKPIFSKADDYGTTCDCCGKTITNVEPGHIPINEHVTGIKDMVCCIDCASVIQKQNSAIWDSLLITTIM